nr:protein FAR1-related sequence 5 [Tanacetum cinerariifolium]
MVQLFVHVSFCESWYIMQAYFFVFKNANVEMIPQQYILRRWMKNLIPAALSGYGEKNVVVENFANEATSIVDYCVHLLSKDEPRNSCSLCGGTDHNKRTCPGRFEVEEVVLPKKCVKRKLWNSCSLCGGTDHNKRTCPGKDNKEKDKIRAKTGQNQEQTGSMEKSRVKPDKVKAQSKQRKHQM